MPGTARTVEEFGTALVMQGERYAGSTTSSAPVTRVRTSTRVVERHVRHLVVERGRAPIPPALFDA